MSELGSLRISLWAIKKMAFAACRAVQGVSVSSPSCVKVALLGDGLRLVVPVILSFGVDLLEKASEVQSKIKAAIEELGGIVVSEVNLEIAGVTEVLKDEQAG